MAYITRVFLICYLIIYLINFVFALYSVTKEKVVITERGIEYHKLVFSIDVDWNNIQEIGRYWFREGMFVDREAVTQYTPSRIFITYGGLGQTAFIPLSGFANNWRTSEIGNAIRKYAPHLNDYL